MKKKFKTIALGCRTNQYEGQAFHDQLLHLGFSPAQEEEAAELCIINTCTVTAGADVSSRSEIRQMVKKNPGAKIVVTGCYAERDQAAVQSIDGVTHVVANQDKERLIEILFPDEENLPEFSITRFEAHTRAFVKVQDGCNSFCTYCIIPYVRGRSRSRSIQEIVQEVHRLVEQGYQEIVLTGINIGDFDGNGEGRLVDLVKAVDQVEGVKRLRISSIDPDEVDEALLEAVLSGRSTCPSMHIVLQSGSNVILKRMNRKYTRQIFLETTERLRQAHPDFTFTTDIIVGFPGETESDFQETLAVMKEVKFAKVHMFPYSDRPRTRAATYPNKVDSQVKNQRREKVLRLSEKLSWELRENYVGRVMTVLTESEGRGHTENFLEVEIPHLKLPPNQLITVKLIGNAPHGLIGELV